ncbi:MAG TPA: L,D-transpeptidase [Acidimicrobiales bacterium]|nr:L,D-transpeptidase [Acidimicrobiales bacterium]
MAGLAVATASCASPHAVAKPAPASPPAPKVHKAVVAGLTAPAGMTMVALTHGAIPGSPEPGAPETLEVPSNWYGYPSILPVIASKPNWVEVRLAQRPNGSTTWVPLSDVSISYTPYRIVVDLSTERLTVYKLGQEIDDFPAGIGAPDEPTVTGHYFMTMQAAAPNAGYGPFVLVTSAHSDTITDWQASGDAIIAIHGPISSYDDSLIGTTGAAISHGCIRLHDADLAQLADIPPGTPIDIVSSQA